MAFFHQVELNFTISEGRNYNSGKFIIDNLHIKKNTNYKNEITSLDVCWDNLELYLDGNLYRDTISAFNGMRIDSEDIFDQCLNAYIRGERYDYKSFGEEWSVFNEILILAKKIDDLFIKLPFCDGGFVTIYELQFATSENLLYESKTGKCAVYNKEDMGLITDMECWYECAMDENICAVLRGEDEFLYTDEGFDEYLKNRIDEYGGKEAFLAENIYGND